MQVPITTNNDAHSRYVSPFLEKNYAGFGPSHSELPHTAEEKAGTKELERTGGANLIGPAGVG